jgi:comEA protein
MSPILLKVISWVRAFRWFILAGVLGICAVVGYWKFPGIRPYVHMPVDDVEPESALAASASPLTSTAVLVASVDDLRTVQNEVKELDDHVNQQQTDVSQLRDAVAAMRQELQKAINEVSADSNSSVYTAPEADKTSSSPTSTPKSGKVNVNTATETELETLPGIGPAMAQRIIDYRKQQGGFKTVADLLEVKGIGDATLAKFRDKVEI